jgi:hypothetical protein
LTAAVEGSNFDHFHREPSGKIAPFDLFVGEQLRELAARRERQTGGRVRHGLKGEREREPVIFSAAIPPG